MTTKAEKRKAEKRKCAEDFEMVQEMIRTNKTMAKRMRKDGSLITLTFKKSEWMRYVDEFEEQKKKETDEELSRIKQQMNKVKAESNKSTFSKV